jgi:cell division protein FtsB
MEDLYYRKPQRRGLFRRFRARRVIVGALIALPVLGYVLFGSHGVVQRFRLEREKEVLKAEIEAAQKENERLRAESKALDGDMKAIEKVAREKYGMAREGETVYRIKRSRE